MARAALLFETKLSQILNDFGIKIVDFHEVHECLDEKIAVYFQVSRD